MTSRLLPALEIPANLSQIIGDCPCRILSKSTRALHALTSLLVRTTVFSARSHLVRHPRALRAPQLLPAQRCCRPHPPHLSPPPRHCQVRPPRLSSPLRRHRHLHRRLQTSRNRREQLLIVTSSTWSNSVTRAIRSRANLIALRVNSLPGTHLSTRVGAMLYPFFLAAFNKDTISNEIRLHD